MTPRSTALTVLGVLLLTIFHTGHALDTTLRTRGARTSREVVDLLLSPSYVAGRVAKANREAAARESMMDKAAELARTWARQALPVRSVGKKPAQVDYVDLSQGPSLREEKPKSLTPSMEAEDAEYPRYPGHYLPVPDIQIVCPTKYSVTARGVYGNGVTSNDFALNQANSIMDYLFFPPGVYRVSYRVTLSKPVVMAAGAYFSVDGGAILTITKRFHKWFKDEPAFVGAGQVSFVEQADEILPAWFQKTGPDDSDMLQSAVRSCGGVCTIMLTRQFLASRGWLITSNIGVLSTNAGSVYGGDPTMNPTGEGVVLQPGIYQRPLFFGLLWEFHRLILKIPGGVENADLQFHTLVNGQDGIMFSPGEGTGNVIKNVFITHLTATTNVQNTVILRTTGPGQAIKNCVVRGNFLVNGGHFSSENTNAGLAIVGPVAPILQATSVIYQAVDSTKTDDTMAPFNFLQNAAGSFADNVIMQVQAWAGGLSGDERVIVGDFNHLRMSSNMATAAPTALNLLPHLDGVDNRVVLGTYSSAAYERRLALTSERDEFGPSVVEQAFYVSAPISSDWPPGEERNFFFYSALANVASEEQMHCIPHRVGNYGIVCTGFKKQDMIVEGRVLIRVKNAANVVITPSMQAAFRFAVQIGP